MCWLLRAPDKRFSHTLDSLGRWPRPVCSFRSAQAATMLEFHVLLTNCFVRRWFCVVHGPKPPLHHHNWLSFGRFQDTESFLIPCPRHVSSGLPLAVKLASTPWHLVQKNGEILYLLMCFFLLCLSWLLRSRVRKLWITLHSVGTSQRTEGTSIRKTVCECHRDFKASNDSYVVSHVAMFSILTTQHKRQSIMDSLVQPPWVLFPLLWPFMVKACIKKINPVI